MPGAQRLIRLGSALVLLALLHTPAAPAQQPPCAQTRIAPLQLCPFADRLTRLVASDSTPAAAVAVVQRGRIIWERGFGEIDRASHLPASPGSIFFLASVSKSITSIGVLHLAEQRRLDLDAPVSRYLEPGIQTVYAGSPDSVTARALLQMTAGVPHVVRFAWADDAEQPPTETELVRKFGFVAFPAGRHFDYSNMSFGVLQHVVTRASGRPYATYLADEVFRPYGMAHTTMQVTDRLKPYEAKVYARGSNAALPLLALQPEAGAGLHSSAHDLALLALRLLHSPAPVLSKASVKTMWSGALPQPYALGWWRIDLPDGTHTVVADGNATGTAVSVVIAPERDAAVVVLFSDGGAPSLPIAQDIMLALSERRDSPRAQTPSAEPQAPPYFQEQPFRADSGWTGSWLGSVHVDGDTIPLSIRVDSAAALSLALDRAERVPVTRVYVVQDGLLRGRFDGSLPAQDTRAQPHRLEIALRREGDRLVGHLTATSRGDRTHFVLPYFVSLRRINETRGESTR
jgi:CubicO group peptidase (beta-lactamase class C family)